MKLSKQENPTDLSSAVVGVFQDAFAASRVAASLRGPDLSVLRVSRQDPTAEDVPPLLHYDEVDHVQASDVSQGMLTGGAIGVGSGLLLLGVPGLNVAAPVIGGLVGAWIGGVAGIAEADRAADQPPPDRYRELLAAGKSLVVIAANDSRRADYARELTQLGAEEVHHHPPLGHVVRSGEPEAAAAAK